MRKTLLTLLPLPSCAGQPTNTFRSCMLYSMQFKQAGMSCAQPQAEAVSLEQKASFLLKSYIRPLVAKIFPLSLGFKFE